TARLYGVFMRGKPLTGYHAVMFVLPLWSFHIGFFAGVPWSWPAEAATLAAYMIWVVAWDFIWFLLNPPFGWGRFRKGEVWWHGAGWPGGALGGCRGGCPPPPGPRGATPWSAPPPATSSRCPPRPPPRAPSPRRPTCAGTRTGGGGAATSGRSSPRPPMDRAT